LISTLRKRIGNKEDLFQDTPLVYFVDYALLVDTLRDRYSDSYDATLMENAFNVPLLLLDDVGSGKMSDYAREQTNILINHRYGNNLLLI
jgi:DNA replication protein DnaC